MEEVAEVPFADIGCHPPVIYVLDYTVAKKKNQLNFN